MKFKRFTFEVTESEKNMLNDISEFFSKIPPQYDEDIEQVFYDDSNYDVTIDSVCEFLDWLKNFVEVEK